MGVMCSLLGHDYGDPDVERERSEEGTEVVLTAKRVERCRNCDHERTIAENTEVTALSAAAGVVRDDDGRVVVSSNGSGTADGDDRPARSSSDRDGKKSAEREEAGSADAITPRTDGQTERTHEDSSPASLGNPEADGSVGTLDASEGESSGAGGSIVDSVTAGSALGQPTTEVARAGTNDDADPDPSNESGESTIDRVHDRPPARDRPHRAPGEWPAESLSATEPERAVADSSDSATSTGRWPDTIDDEPNPVRDGGASETVRDGEAPDRRIETTRSGSRTATGSFACSSCGFDTGVADSPLRAGDICPHCGVGYLALETRKG